MPIRVRVLCPSCKKTADFVAETDDRELAKQVVQDAVWSATPGATEIRGSTLSENDRIPVKGKFDDVLVECVTTKSHHAFYPKEILG